MKVEAARFKIQALRILSMVGGILAAIGTLNLAGVAALLPENVAGWITFVGLMCMSAKQAVMWLGDLLDNGKQDGSFHILWLILLIPASLFFGGCEHIHPPVVLIPDCIAMPVEASNGQTYYIGRCGNGIVVQWKDELGTVYQVVRNDDTDDLSFYRIVEGKRIPLGAKDPRPEPPPLEEITA